MDMRFDDFPNENRFSKGVVRSLVKIEEDWTAKEKGDGFGNEEELPNDLFYLSMN